MVSRLKRTYWGSENKNKNEMPCFTHQAGKNVQVITLGAGKDARDLCTSYVVSGNVTWFILLEKQS